MASRTDYEIFDLGDFTLSGGATLRGARLAYKTYGTLSENRDNAIVYPTWYSGRHWENEWLIGGGMTLDPARYFGRDRLVGRQAFRDDLCVRDNVLRDRVLFDGLHGGIVRRATSGVKATGRRSCMMTTRPGDWQDDERPGSQGRIVRTSPRRLLVAAVAGTRRAEDIHM